MEKKGSFKNPRSPADLTICSISSIGALAKEIECNIYINTEMENIRNEHEKMNTRLTSLEGFIEKRSRDGE